MKFDLHTHTKYSSDGIIEPEKLVKTAIKRGLSGIAITDHDTL
ncbi:MAG TPA: PHP domain-containing protein, partial [Methanobacterium subterraneum]|nr:PHP domain-containing protein [Methanobacterium subterraneum]